MPNLLHCLSASSLQPLELGAIKRVPQLLKNRKMSLSCLEYCRLKVSGSFYEDFKAQDVASEKNPGAISVRLEAAPAASKTLEYFQALVHGAVLSVLGTSVNENQPLVEAGVDSLGKSQITVILSQWKGRPCSSQQTACHYFPDHEDKLLDHAVYRNSCQTQSKWLTDEVLSKDWPRWLWDPVTPYNLSMFVNFTSIASIDTLYLCYAYRCSGDEEWDCKAFCHVSSWDSGFRLSNCSCHNCFSSLQAASSPCCTNQ